VELWYFGGNPLSVKTPSHNKAKKGRLYHPKKKRPFFPPFLFLTPDKMSEYDRDSDGAPREAQQGLINIGMLPDVKNMENGARSDYALYPCKNADVFNMYDGQIAFQLKGHRHDYDSRPKVMTALNGLGGESLMRFQDENLAAKHLESQLDVVGVATQRYTHSTDKDSNTGIAGQIGGVGSAFTYVDIPFGVPLRATVHPPSFIQKTGKCPAQNRSQILLGVVPYTPTVLSEQFNTMMRAYAKRPANFTNNIDYRKREEKEFNSQAIACATMMKWEMMAGVLLLERLLKAGVIRSLDLGVDYATVDPAATDTQKLIALMKGLRIFPEDPDILENVNISSDQQREFDRVSRDVVRTLHNDMSVSNYVFGYDPISRTNPGINPANMRVKESTPHGMAINAQTNLSGAMMAAVSEFVQADRGKIFGKSIGSCSGGNLVPFVS
jgi:hypothetical protein